MPTVTQPGAEPRRSSREDALNQISQKRVEELNAELADDDKVEFVPITTAKPEKDDDGEDTVAGAVDAAETPAGAEGADTTTGAEGADTVAGDIYDFLGEERLSKTKVKIKVDGQEQELVVADLVRDAQKHKAADKRLEDAAHVRRQAEADAVEIRKNAETEAASIKAAAGKPNEGDALPDKDAITKAVSHLFDGEQELAGAALLDVIDRRVAELKPADATVDTHAIASQVRHDLAWDQALETFVADQPTIAKDPYLLGMWQSTLNEVAKESHTPAEAVKKATERTQDWLKRVSGTPAKPTDDGALANRQARKDAAGRLHVAPSTSTRAPGPARDPGPAKPSDIIAEMKAARGQA